ncbi:metal-dependent hydrolase [Streptomyces sirii]|uniref:metal-dependent hydrolase n=1 Tax=Streptomyces sirii TaxID=3127701 RepID=UPI003D367A4C
MHRTAPPEELADLVQQVRDVEFDWSRLPMHWIPGEPQATHTINTLHLLVPGGERWFVEVLREALPLIGDDRLREQVQGFMGQEVLHAEAHQEIHDVLLSHGLDPRPYVAQIEWIFHRVLGDRGAPMTKRQRLEALIDRVAVVAALEHFTAVLGDWVIQADDLDRAGADPVMLDILRWHGAEEVIHRSVSYDVLQYLDRSYGRRLRGMLMAGSTLAWLWIRGVRFLMAADPELAGRVKPRFRAYRAASRRGLLPELAEVGRSVVWYCSPGHHPFHLGSTRRAVAYLGRSPAVRRAGL